MPAETHVRGRGGDTRSVAEVVFEVVSEVTGRPLSDLSTDDLLSVLGISGLVLLDVVETVGEELGERTVGLEVDDERLDGISSLGELIDLIGEGLEEGRGE